MAESETKEEYNFYNRMNEIGEYTYNNRLDTIFVFQIMFIAILIIVILLYLKSIGIVTSFFVYPMSVLLIIIVIFILINRIVLTNKIRNKRDWSKLNFGDGLIAPPDYVSSGKPEGDFGVQTAPPPPICPAGQRQSISTECVPE
jgi:hypothetical protein